MRDLPTVLSYAQNREDILLDAFFPDVKRGFYVDVGANHPVDDSVTKYFYDKGWHGINIEPNSRLFSLLEQSRPRDINVRAGISDQTGTLTLREYEGWHAGLSTFSKDMQQENKGVAKYRDIEVEVITLKELFTRYSVDTIQFLKIDVEGYEYNVIKSNDWERYRPEMICIEANHTFKDWRALLKKARYKQVFFDGLNEYYLAEEAADREKKFSYIQRMIGKSIIDVRVERAIHALEHRLEQQQNEAEMYKSEILRLNHEVIELKKVIPLTKQLFKSLDGSVRRRIEKLNAKKQTSTALPQFNMQDAQDIHELQAHIRHYDFEAYYRTSWEKDRVGYRVVHGTYDMASRAGFATGKKLLGLMRRIKK